MKLKLSYYNIFFYFQNMSLFTGLILLDLIGFIVAIFAVIYAYFIWAFQSWKRKNIPNLEPHFPFGNSQPLGKAVHLGEDIYNIVNRAKEQGNRQCLKTMNQHFVKYKEYISMFRSI